MVMEQKKNKKVTVIIISILIILILVLAISFAFFSTQLNGTDQIVKVGTLDLVLDETSEGISLDNAIGLSDDKGMSLTPSTFKLINNGNKAVDYTIYLDNNSISDIDTRIDDKYLKYNLNKNGTDSGATLLTKIGSNPNRILDSGTIEGKGTNEYSLNLWITDEVDGNYSGQVFSGKLRVEVSQERPTVAEVLLADSANNINTTDPDQTFITGENPNNYIWYSGKLWRAVAIDTSDNSVKLVTQWNISTILYDNDSSAFEGSHMEMWLNDETVDGFLGNLRSPESFIKMDSRWNDNPTNGTYKPTGETVINPVGLLNLYEYVMSYSNTTSSNCYLNNNISWWTVTNNGSGQKWYISNSGNSYISRVTSSNGIRPSINLKPSIKIVDGSGTVDDPYRLMGDNDINLEGVKLNTRYSGEYIRFGNDENNLYRIVSHESKELTKITSVNPLKENETFKMIQFGNDSNYSSNNIIGTFLNGEYLGSGDYLTNEEVSMIEDNTTWYLGKIERGENYKLAKYIDEEMTNTTISTTSKVGLLRLGELMAGQDDVTSNNDIYWLLTPYSASHVWYLYNNGLANNGYNTMNKYAIKPSLNLKSNVIITSGDGTLQNPFEIELSS